MNNIQMVDLKSQYLKIKAQIDKEVLDTISSTKYINGPKVHEFSLNLSNYLGCKHVIPCANGTDALQIALMSCNLKPGDEVICPSFTYVATAEVVALLGLKPVMANVDENTFNMRVDHIEPLITTRTKAIVPVHLFGQSANMEEILILAKKYDLFVIEDNAQAIGANYKFSNGQIKKTGTIGHIGTTSFFPSKNLGCYGDGGAMFTNDDNLAEKIKMIANHGQNKRYYHKVTGCNSRLDSIQAAILNVKLKYLDEYNSNREKMAEAYDIGFGDLEHLNIPYRSSNSTHVFHQYTLKTSPKYRDKLIKHLTKKEIPAMIYYPVPLYKQEAFSRYVPENYSIENIEKLCSSVFSLPIHSEKENSQQDKVIDSVRSFFNSI
ncbi:DegT/DnrJ/EryC1/StrS family aminotransferase [Flavobacteriales bacterium]|nr:DegT/DnrJ/EryC1/StrS family aminotransferase [Flavobacteriales bacterium]